MPRRFRRWGHYRGGAGGWGGWRKKKSRSRSSSRSSRQARQVRGPRYSDSTASLRNLRLSQVIQDLTADTIDMTTVAMGDDDLDHEVLFGTLRGNIVGIRYYRGEVNNNEMVSLVREPRNPYDSNAVRVDNVMGVQVGHIKRELARPLAYIVDQGLARVEGVVPHGAMNIFTMPVDLTFWGRPERREDTILKLGQHGYKIKPPAGAGGSGTNRGGSGEGGREGAGPSYMDRVLLSAVQMTQAEMKNELDQLFETIQESDQTGVTEACQSIRTPLFPHQKQALAWMARRENSGELPPFWEERAANKFFNSVTNFTSTRRPQSVRGGILADDMGLGKTLVVISLILSNFRDGKPLVLPQEGAAMTTKGKSIKARKGGARSSNRKKTMKPGQKEKFVVDSDSEEGDTETESEESVSGESESDSPVSDSDMVAMTKAEDPEYAPKMKLTRAKTAPPVVSPNIRSRPSRTTRKPVRYTYSSGEDGEDITDGESPRKKAKTSSPVPEKQTKKGGKAKSKTKAKGKAKGKGKTLKGKFGGSEDVVDLTVSPPGASNSQPHVISDEDDDELPDLPAMDESNTGKKDSRKVTATKITGLESPPCGGRTEAEGPRATLVVCPLSVLSNWIDQLEEHVHPNVDLHIYTYYGPDRTKDHKVLEQQDIVLTTYQMMAMDAKGKGGPLQKVQWLRVVLDEGHTIRNPAAQQSKAAFALKAERTWVLTGTPIQNSMKDLWSIVCFLKLEPFTDRQWWRRTIERPIGLGDQSALKCLQKLMGNLAMRRTKTQQVAGKPLVELPPRTVFIQHVEMSADEREVYDSMATEGKVMVGRYFREGSVLTHYADVLAVLLRLRQLCCHPSLVARALQTLTEAVGSGTSGELREKLMSVLKAVLSSGADEECCVCLDSLRLPVITHCAHVFCRECICTVIRNERPNAHCPLCRGDIAVEQLVEAPPDEEGGREEEEQGGPWQSSSKVDAVLQCLERVRQEDSSVKSLVVSQFTSFLNIMEYPLREAGFRFVRLDGSMTQQKRTDAIARFHDDGPDSPNVMLLSLKAGGIGLNLKAASRVFLLDPDIKSGQPRINDFKTLKNI
ncbi:helicase-like transcription factor [Branchiostoma floridae]|uniref:Helicase-like transcription factor n=1 Tax=Branchiostoma floridae TaxID=7739 RepID=A0A9J7M2W2_BRAFL|nr:helicase-like transcription factor [Branchiostoma floridae]